MGIIIQAYQTRLIKVEVPNFLTRFLSFQCSSLLEDSTVARTFYYENSMKNVTIQKNFW